MFLRRNLLKNLIVAPFIGSLFSWKEFLNLFRRKKKGLTEAEKQAIIIRAIESQGDSFATGMVEPIRSYIDYHKIGRKLLLIQEI